jgi:aminopeptidase N
MSTARPTDWRALDSDEDEEELDVRLDGQNFRTFTAAEARSRKLKRYGAMAGVVLLVAALILIIALTAGGGGAGAGAGGDGDNSGGPANNGSTSDAMRTPSPASMAVRRADTNAIRLPEWVVPRAYRIDVEADFALQRVFGVVEIDLQFKAVTPDVLLHAHELNVSHATIKRTGDSAEQLLAGAPAAFAGDRQFVLLSFPWLQAQLEAQKGDLFTLRLHYTALLRNDMSGFYRSTYKDAAGVTQQLAATQFESESARSAFPCFDEPAFKATYDVALRVDVAKFPTVLSNMPELSREPAPRSLNDNNKNATGLTRVKFKTTPPMSTYLVAFVIGDLAKRDAPASTAPSDDHEHDQAAAPPRVAISVYTTHDTINQTVYAAWIARQALNQFESIFQIEYPLPKLDLVAIPDFSAGAMENWGLITFRTVALLYDVRHSTAADKERVGEVVVHEIAHQWFGNLVTMAWWDELWLNEGFATFMSYLCLNAVYQQQSSAINETGWLMWESFAGVQRIAMAIDSLAHTHPIRQTVQRPSDVELLFDAITYDKGGSLLRMLYKSSVMQGGNFELGVTRYLQDRKYSNARSTDLFARWAMASAEPDLAELLEPWIALAGFPVVTFRQVEVNSFVAVQQRYSEEVGAVPANDTSTWWVPLSIQNDDAQTVINLKPGQRESARFDVSRSYFVANADRWGLYRVAYTPAMLASLVDHIILKGIRAPYQSSGMMLAPKDLPITPMDYAGTLDDLRSFSVTGFNNVTAADVLTFAQFVNKTRSQLCWSTALSVFGSFHGLLSRGGFAEPSDRMAQFVLATINSTVFDALGLAPDSDSAAYVDHMLEKLYASILPYAVRLNHTVAVSYARDCYVQAASGGACGAGAFRVSPGFVAPQLQSAVFTYAAMYNASAFDDLFDRFTKTTYPAESRRLLSALVLVEDPARRDQLLRMTLNGGAVRPQDRSQVLLGVAGASNEGRAAAWTFIQQNFKELSGSNAILGGGSRFVAGMGSLFATQAELTSFTDFVNAHKSEGLDGRNIEQAIEAAQHNIAWLARNLASIKAFFKLL